MRKKLFAVIMSAMMMITFMPSMAFAAETPLACTVSALTWTDTSVSATLSYADPTTGNTATQPVSFNTVKTFNNDTGLTSETATIGTVILKQVDTTTYTANLTGTTLAGPTVSKSYYDLTGAKFGKINATTSKFEEVAKLEANAFATALATATEVNPYAVTATFGDTIHFVMPAGATATGSNETFGVKNAYADIALSNADVSTNLAVKVGAVSYNKYDEGTYSLPVTIAKKNATEAVVAKVKGESNYNTSVQVYVDSTTALADPAFTVDGVSVAKLPVSGGFSQVKYNGKNHDIAFADKGVKVEWKTVNADQSVTWSETAPAVKNVVASNYTLTYKATLTKTGAVKNGTLKIAVVAADPVIKFAQSVFYFGEGYKAKNTDLLTSAFAAEDADLAKDFFDKFVTVNGVISKQGQNDLTWSFDKTAFDAAVGAETSTISKAWTQFKANYGLDSLQDGVQLVSGGATPQKATLIIKEAKANKVTVSTKTINAKAKKAISKKISAKAKSGTVTFKKVSGNKKISVAKSGKVTVKKGLKKGKTYTLKVKASVAANGLYGKASKTATIKVKVK